MDKNVLSVKEDVQVIFEVHGDLQVKGDDILEVIVKADSPEDLQVDQAVESNQGDQVNIRCLSDCSVRLPLQARLRLNQVHGDAMIKAVEGEIEVEAVHGELALRSVGTTSVNMVHGSLEARNVSGNFKAKQVEGNLTVRNVRGELLVGRAGGNVMLEDIDDAVQVNAAGNAVLRLDPAPGEDYMVEAGGNISWSFPEDASAVIHIKRAGRLVANLPGVDPKGLRPPCTVTLGEGDAEISLSAGGNISLSPQGPRLDMADLIDFDLETSGVETSEILADQISQQIEAQMATLEQQLNAHLANLSVTLGNSGLSPEHIARIQARAREASVHATERTQERMRRAQERLERKLAAVQQRAEQRARQAEQRTRQVEERARRVEERMHRHQWSFTWPEPPRPPASPTAPGGIQAAGDPVSDEERLSVLRMLKEKKITLEQAEKLLAAMEGKE